MRKLDIRSSIRLLASLDVIYAVALHDLGRRAEARRVLEAVLARHRRDRETLLALVDYWAESGDQAGASALMQQLTAINPEDPALRQPGQE